MKTAGRQHARSTKAQGGDAINVRVDGPKLGRAPLVANDQKLGMESPGCVRAHTVPFARQMRSAVTNRQGCAAALCGGDGSLSGLSSPFAMSPVFNDILPEICLYVPSLLFLLLTLRSPKNRRKNRAYRPLFHCKAGFTVTRKQAQPRILFSGPGSVRYAVQTVNAGADEAPAVQVQLQESEFPK